MCYLLELGVRLMNQRHSVFIPLSKIIYGALCTLASFKMSYARLILLVPFITMDPGYAAGNPAQNLDPDGIGWQQAVFHTSKFFVSGRAEVSLAVEPSAALIDELLKVDFGAPVGPEVETVRLTYIADGLGRHAETMLLMRPHTAAAIQYETYEPGKRRRIYGYMEQGAYQRTWRPLAGEEKNAPAQWTDISEGLRPYPEVPQQGTVVDPLGLLYVIASARTEAALSNLDLLAYSSNRLSRIILDSDGLSIVNVNFSMGSGSKQQQCTGKLSVLKIRINALPFGADTEADFDFFGLQSDISVLLDPQTRLPLLISGRAKIVGELEIKLREATLRNGKCPDFLE